MALFGSFNPLISGVLNVIGQSGGLLGGIGNVGAQVVSASAARPAAATISAGPVMSTGLAAAPQIGQTVMAGARAVGAGVQRALIALATTIGARTMTLGRAMRIYRKIRKFVVDPYIIAQIMGLTIDQLGELLIADSQKTRRRMNPGNIHALRRAHRRVEGFHRICGKNDKLRATRRRSPSRRSGVVMKCA
jgi:hypothetical protein